MGATTETESGSNSRDREWEHQQQELEATGDRTVAGARTAGARKEVTASGSNSERKQQQAVAGGGAKQPGLNQVQQSCGLEGGCEFKD